MPKRTRPSAARIAQIRTWADLTYTERELLAALDHVRNELMLMQVFGDDCDDCTAAYRDSAQRLAAYIGEPTP